MQVESSVNDRISHLSADEFLPLSNDDESEHHIEEEINEDNCIEEFETSNTTVGNEISQYLTWRKRIK